MHRRHWNKIAETAIVKDFNNSLPIQKLNHHTNQPNTKLELS